MAKVKNVGIAGVSAFAINLFFWILVFVCAECVRALLLPPILDFHLTVCLIVLLATYYPLPLIQRGGK